MAAQEFRAKTLTAAAVRWLRKQNLATSAEIGICKWGKLRADALGLAMRGDLTMIEVKSSVADFRSDRKWHKYLAYTNKMYFCVSPKTYLKIKDEIPKGIGIMVVHEYPRKSWNGQIKNVKTLNIVQGARRREIDPQLYIDVLIRMAYRNSDINGWRNSRDRKVK